MGQTAWFAGSLEMRWSSCRRRAMIADTFPGRRNVRITICLLLVLSQIGQADDLQITHGPILGRPGVHSMAVWARTSRPGAFTVHFNKDGDRRSRLSTRVECKLENDNTGWVLLEGLASDSRYHYRVVPEGSNQGPDGTFRTLPDSTSFKEEKTNPRGLFNFRFEVSCCANQGPHSIGPKLPAYQTMLKQIKDKVYFSIHNGDFIYEEKREFNVEQWLDQVGVKKDKLPRLLEVAPTITGVWENYKLYLERGKSLAEWHRHVPCFFTFDDHEILNDATGQGTVGYRDRRTVFRDIAVQGWHDYVGWANPIESKQGIHFGTGTFQENSDVLTDTAADFSKLDLKQAGTLHVHWGTPDAGVNDDKLDKQSGDPNAGVYEVVEILDKNRLKIRPAAKKDGQQSYSIGRMSHSQMRVGNCHYFFLDTRGHREKHDPKKPDKPGVTMLGKVQKQWLLDEMKKSDADFFFVVSTVNFTISHSGAGGMAVAADDKDDAWTAYLDEREQLLKAWERLNKPVFVFTGDLHNSFAVKITDKIWEFGCAPLNSTNHNLGSEGGRPANGPYNSAGRKCEIRWSTFFADDSPRDQRRRPVYCVVQVNNVFDNPPEPDKHRWIAYPKPQVVFAYYDGLTGDLLYCESVLGGGTTKK